MNFARESFFEESYRNRAAPNATLRHGKPGKDFPPIGASARPRKRGRELATLEQTTFLCHNKPRPCLSPPQPVNAGTAGRSKPINAAQPRAAGRHPPSSFRNLPSVIIKII